MSQLHIHHSTIYRYQKSVNFGAHQLRIRPIEDHEKKIITFDLHIEPTHRIRWAYDQFQNPVGYVEFTKASKELVVVSDLKVELGTTNPFDFILEPYCVQLPFTYSSSELPDLIPYLTPLYPQEKEVILNWIKPFLNLKGEAKTIDFLSAINRAIPKLMSYQERLEIGTQTPGETLKNRSGACRDFAVLFMETARHLGIASRFVSGYIRNILDVTEKTPNLAAGAMHAWAQVYLPGAGWKDFDPTAGVLTSNEHLRVAVGRTPEQTTPILGSYLGKEKLDLGFEVDVQVSTIN
ncbi:MAG: transglutaminase family protein [Verrucomicrobiota bacterium]